MLGSVSVTNNCGEEMPAPVWTQLSVGYPYHYDATARGETTTLRCGMVWLSVKVNVFHPTSRAVADARRNKGRWAIFKGILVVASFGTALLVEDWDSSLGSVTGGGLEALEAEGAVSAGIEALGGGEMDAGMGVLEVGETVGEAAEEAARGGGNEQHKRALENVKKWVIGGPVAGLAFMNVGRSATSREVGVTLVVGHIRRGIYAGTRPSFKVESKVYMKDDDVLPPRDRVDPKIWEDFKVLERFEKLVLLTLVNA